MAVFEIPGVLPGEYRLHLFHERATAARSDAVERRVTVTGAESAVLPDDSISESGYLAEPHMNNYGHDYAPAPDELGGISGNCANETASLRVAAFCGESFLSTSIAITALFAVMGWILREQFVRSASESVGGGGPRQLPGLRFPVAGARQSTRERQPGIEAE